MAKRFIDTNMFSDEWVHSLSKDGKLFFVYYITNCDHAGVLKLNRSLCEFQTGLKNFDTLIKDFGNTLITVKENVYFMPRFVKFQYPKFPQSNVKQQDSAIKILKSYNLFNEETNSYVTLSKELANPYVSDSVSDSDVKLSNNTINIDFEIFWNLYNKKKGDKDKIKIKWEKLNDDDRQKIINTLPTFLNSISDKQYQPFPETYLNNKRWNDEIEIKTEKKQYTLSSPLGNWTGILTEDELKQKTASGYFKLEN